MELLNLDISSLAQDKKNKQMDKQLSRLGVSATSEETANRDRG
jgi:hypothetical protein